MSGLVSRKRILRIAIEGTKGAAEANTTAHLVAWDVEFNPQDDTQMRPAQRGSAGQFRSVPGLMAGTARFSTELKTNGTNNLDAGLLALLQGAGWKLATNVLTPADAIGDQTTLTLDCFTNGRLKRLYGAQGNVRWVFQTGRPTTLECEFQGIFATPTDAALPAVTPSAVMPVRAEAASLTVGSWTPMLSEATLDLQNQISAREDVTAARGIRCYVITGREPIVTIDGESELIGDHDTHGAWLSGAQAALALGLSDGAVTIAVAAPAAQLRTPQERDRNGIAVDETVIQLNDSATGDISITMAAVPGE